MSDFDDEHHGGGKDDVRRRARERLMTEGAEVGVRVLIELAEDKSQKGSTRGAAAKALVHSSGSTLPTLSQEDLAEMPAEKIRALLVETQRALEARTKLVEGRTIEHAPSPRLPPPARSEAATDTAQAGGLFD